MGKSSVTILDIAEKAGVSVGTVSNYLNNPEIVSERSRKAIQEVIDELGYQPRAAARSLKSNRTYRLGFVPLISPEENRSHVPSDNVFLEFFSAVNTTAAENDYSILLHAATSPDQELAIYKKLVRSRAVDGMILMGTKVKDLRIEYLTEQAFPFVSFGRSTSGDDHAYVDVDGTDGMLKAVRHLVQLGHREIGYISPPERLMCTKHRWEGFLTAFEELGLEIEDRWVIQGGFSEDSGQRAAQLLFDQPQIPTAVITPNDLSAFGVMRELKARNLETGADVSVVGFDNIRLASHWQPPLTTISQPLRELGFTAIMTLIKIITSEETNRQYLVEPELIVRESTGKAPTK